MKKINWNNHLSTILGGVVAIANAWITIDWDNFQFNFSNLMKLSLSALVAIGGYKTRINTKDESN
jgi:hypothetical protein